MEKIEEITENSSSVRYFEFEKQQKKGRFLRTEKVCDM